MRLFFFKVIFVGFVIALFSIMPGFTLTYASGDEDNEVTIISLRPGQDFALVNEKKVSLREKVYLKEGTTMVPLRFFSETLGANVKWQKGEILISHQDKQLTLWPGKKEGRVNGKTPFFLTRAPENIKGVVLVPLKNIANFFGAEVSYLAAEKNITVTYTKKAPLPPEEISPPNLPPVASFSVDKQVVKQGETVNYQDKSFDPDGDLIVTYNWQGKKRAFFTPGEHKVSLRVKDEKGSWSEPYELFIKVTDEVLCSELNYHLQNPLPGDVVNLDPANNPLNFPEIEVSGRQEEDVTLLRSNSPEVIKQPGILYQDKAEGMVRLLYHHKNGCPEKISVYALVYNENAWPVKLRILKKGYGGPSVGDLGVGGRGVARYLNSATEDWLEIAPGQILALNDTQGTIMLPEQSIIGLIDLETKEPLTFIFAAAIVSRKEIELVGAYGNTPLHLLLPALERDVHGRGTFSKANRQLTVVFSGNKSKKLVIADGEKDKYLVGVDALNYNLAETNKGNYGVVYKIRVRANSAVGVFLNPRGGIFSGAVKGKDQKVFLVPLEQERFLRPKDTAAMLGVIDEGEEGEFTFMPPCSSSLPVYFLFIPVT
jgi:PKD repeat protein